jgi:signal transduction histidine kinase
MLALNKSLRASEATILAERDELAASREQYRLLVETTKTVPWELHSTDLRFRYMGPQICSLLGVTSEACLASGFLAKHVHPDDLGLLRRALAPAPNEKSGDVEVRLKRADGQWLWIRLIATLGRDPVDRSREADTPTGRDVIRGIMLDVSHERQLEVELRQAQKLESVGRLASGVAHEINTPIQFVNDSVYFVRDAVNDLFGVIQRLHAVHHSAVDGRLCSDALAAATAAEEAADLAYLEENVPKALERSLEGLDRVAKIVRSMKEFAHPDQKEMAPIDLNRAITSTLTIARNEYKYVADVVTELETIPQVTCHAGDINQAILNIVVNAAHAIGDVVKGTEHKGTITVRTRRENEDVFITISDTGGGIPDSIRDHVFDPFFTTKEVGKGTGQGLAIARSVVVEKHGGELAFQSDMGKGTTFTIRLPIAGKKRAPVEAAA